MQTTMKRRQFLGHSLKVGTAGLTLGASPFAASQQVSGATGHTSNQPMVAIEASESSTKIVGRDFPATKIWGFNSTVPGPVLKLKQGVPAHIRLTNRLAAPTSIHWHGIRLANAMDGVPGLTQKPVEPDQSFDYQFTPPDAGTYWYHSHMNAYEQVGRGLYGPLIITAEDDPEVDRDLIWLLDDWRLNNDASIINDFGNRHDLSHAGRLGNVPTVNARFRDVVKLYQGERIRLRLINASNARQFALTFPNLDIRTIALDGQAVEPYRVDEPIVIGNAGRVDLLFDVPADAQDTVQVSDSFYREPFDLVRLEFSPPANAQKPKKYPPIEEFRLAAPIIKEPEEQNVKELDVTLGGGAMGGMRQAQMNGKWMDLADIAAQGYVWAMNDVVGNRVDMDPILEVPLGQTVRLRGAVVPTLGRQSAGDATAKTDVYLCGRQPWRLVVSLSRTGASHGWPWGSGARRWLNQSNHSTSALNRYSMAKGSSTTRLSS